MRYFAVACDYDGTLARHGAVDEATLAALRRLKDSGRKLVMVTGRDLDDLGRACPELELFDRIVAENGGVLFDPSRRDIQPLAAPPETAFVAELRRRGVAPLAVGRTIVATWEPNDTIVQQVIRDLRLELQITFNKGAVMVLPSGVNKASGLRHALDDLNLSPHNTVGIGDAENDHAFLGTCECAAAVANALDTVKARVDLVTRADHGAGVVELIDRLLGSDLADLDAMPARRRLVIGSTDEGAEVSLAPHDGAILIAGPSGAGKSTLVTTLLERLCHLSYQFCVVDPEGDYHEFTDAIALRGGDGRALASDVLRVLDRPTENVVATLLDLRLDDRPAFLQQLLPRLLELRAATARPHWIIIDEAHHLLPASWQPSDTILPGHVDNVVMVTVHPDHVAAAALDLVDALIVVGRDPQATLDAFTRARREARVRLPDGGGDGSAWLVRRGAAPEQFRPAEPVRDKLRHQHKYAEGELGEDSSFYFRGPDNRLNLRAQNLEIFVQMADGVDEATWQHHLRNRDVSRWFRAVIKDEALAAEAEAVEADANLSADDSRARIRGAIERRYTKPA